MSSVLVTGATGNVGSHLVQELRRRGVPARAFVRDPGRARADIELAVGDYGEPSTIAVALDGIDRVFLACANSPRQVEYEANVIDAAATAGVRRIVKMSTVGADPDAEGRFAAWHGQAEQAVEGSGVPAVILRSSYHMTNVLVFAESIRGAGKIFAPVDDAKIAMIDRRDLAAVAALVLTEDGHDGRTYLLTGSEAITYRDVAVQLSEVIGKPVEFVDVPDEAALAGLSWLR
jgi:uncharacterized protein YbjT (DUF2867 family)